MGRDAVRGAALRRDAPAPRTRVVRWTSGSSRGFERRSRLRRRRRGTGTRRSAAAPTSRGRRRPRAGRRGPASPGAGDRRGGTPLFTSGSAGWRLAPIRVVEASGVTHLRYRVEGRGSRPRADARRPQWRRLARGRACLKKKKKKKKNGSVSVSVCGSGGSGASAVGAASSAWNHAAGIGVSRRRAQRFGRASAPGASRSRSSSCGRGPRRRVGGGAGLEQLGVVVAGHGRRRRPPRCARSPTAVAPGGRG